MLIEVNPRRAAGSHDGEFHALVTAKERLEAVKDLRALLHDSKVCGKVSVKHVVKAKVAERGCQFSGNNCSGLQAEFLAKGHAYCRCGLCNHNLVRIAEVVQQPVSVVTFREGAGGAHSHALAAVCAVSILEHTVEGGCDCSFKATADGSQHAHRLDLVAHCLAAAAQDALVHIAGYGRGLLLLPHALLSLVGHPADIETGYQFLEFAVTAFGAGKAVVGVV